MGFGLGCSVGSLVGGRVLSGECVGFSVGSKVGFLVVSGECEGRAVGNSVGSRVGAGVCTVCIVILAVALKMSSI